MKDIQYHRVIISTVKGTLCVLWRVFSTAGGFQYYGRISSVYRRVFSTIGNTISTMENTISIVEDIQYC